MLYVRVLVSLIVTIGGCAGGGSAPTKATAETSTDIVSLSMTCAETQAVRDQPPKDPNADPFGFGPWYINADRSIWAGWDVGSWVSGEKGNKVLWIRPQGTQLKITGRRLDADAPPLKARIPCCYPTGFQATRILFPSAGCWEVTAKAGTSTLKFVARIK